MTLENEPVCGRESTYVLDIETEVMIFVQSVRGVRVVKVLELLGRNVLNEPFGELLCFSHDSVEEDSKIRWGLGVKWCFRIEE